MIRYKRTRIEEEIIRKRKGNGKQGRERILKEEKKIRYKGKDGKRKHQYEDGKGKEQE